MDKQIRHVHTMEQDSATGKNEVWIHVKTWMSLENITLSERSQAPKAAYPMIAFL